MANNAKNTVAKAATKAQANTAPTGIEAMIAQFMANMTPEQVLALAKEKGVKLEKSDKPTVDATQFIGKLVKVIGGRKNVGDTFKAYHATKGSQFRKPSVLAEGAETLVAGMTPVFLNPAYLEIVSDLTDADNKRLTAMHKAQADETLYVVAFVKNGGDTENALKLSNKGWARDLWFTKAKGDKEGMISVTGEETPDGEKIFEVAGWKLRKELDTNTYNAIKAQQPALAAIVERKS